MAAGTRIYLVTIGAADRLVRASHPATALMHVARDIAKVKVASQEDIVEQIAGRRRSRRHQGRAA
jgi:hypothetical protein